MKRWGLLVLVAASLAVPCSASAISAEAFSAAMWRYDEHHGWNPLFTDCAPGTETPQTCVNYYNRGRRLHRYGCMNVFAAEPFRQTTMTVCGCPWTLAALGDDLAPPFRGGYCLRPAF